MRPDQLIDPSGTDGTGAAERHCQCSSAGDNCANNNPISPQKTESSAAIFFWDAYDTSNEDPDPGCTLADGGCDNSDMTLPDMLDVWDSFTDGNSNRYDLEDQVGQPAQPAAGCATAFCNGRNVRDFDYWSPDSLSGERDQACADLSSDL